MAAEASSPLTQLLVAANRGDAAAAARLWAVVYAELHRLAHRQLAGEGRHGSLSATALVNEAYLRLAGHAPVAWANRRHFFAAAAEAMRRIRVDAARQRRRLKRGGGQAPEALHADPAVAPDDPAELLALDEALCRLEQLDPRRAEVVKLRYFVELTVDETAAVLDVAPRTVDSDWRFARAWLHRALGPGADQTPAGGNP